MSQKEKILSMVADGKISAEEGEKLLKAVNENLGRTKEKEAVVDVSEVVFEKKEGVSSASKIAHLKGKLVIDIESSDGDNVKVNLPLKLASLAVNMLPKDKIATIEKEGVDIRSILTNINDIVEEMDGDLVNIESSNGDLIRIYIDKK